MLLSAPHHSRLNLVGVALGMGGIPLAAGKHRWQMAWFALPVAYTIGVVFPLDAVEACYSHAVHACLPVTAAITLRYLRVAWTLRP